MKRLHEKFVDEYIKTGKLSQSYSKFYPNSSKKSADSSSSRLIHSEKVKAYYNDRIKELREIDSIQIHERKNLLSIIAIDENSSNSDKIKAVDTLNKMEDIYSDCKNETNISVSLSNGLKELSN